VRERRAAAAFSFGHFAPVFCAHRPFMSAKSCAPLLRPRRSGAAMLLPH
jgi:hypothetical protein